MNSIDKIENSNNLKNAKNKEKISEENLSDKKQANTDSDLRNKWELILSKLELPSTKMLLSQQAELQSIDSNEIIIALSPNWENMIKSRKVVIENAVKAVFGDNIKINFSKKKLGDTLSNNFIEKTNSQTNKVPEKNKTELKNNIQKTTNDDSPKNLANFFNGEIIELE